ncbi:MAG: VCBS repeat-containing protein [Acidobacteria bacterium]|nr:VCBS repeat-containing protein [Acidobacteriota bacterium]
MRVESSRLSFQTAHQLASATRVTEAAIPPRAADTVSLSPLASASAATYDVDFEDIDPKQQLAMLILQALLGQRLSAHHPSAARATTNAATPVAVQVRRRTEVHTESEHMSFQAQGVVQTADGRSIAFSASLSMQREFYSRTTTNTAQSNTTDPLILNFSGAAPRLTNAKIAFDLNTDGTPEQIAFLASGSGFLVLDANADGVVNNGSELFGPQTGDGFAELAAFDSDANGWIDEADPVFAKLQIWTQGGLSSMAEFGVGAISTTSVDTPFAIKDAANNLQGELRATGVYLQENGAARTIQHLDLTT